MKASCWFSLWVFPLSLASPARNGSLSSGTVHHLVGKMSRHSRSILHAMLDDSVLARRMRETQVLDVSTNSPQDCNARSLENQKHQTTCCRLCPPGYFKKSTCSNSGSLCHPCAEKTYTEINNTTPECHRCGTCIKVNMVVEVKCTSSHNTVCACKKEHYEISHQGCFLCDKCRNRQLISNCSKSMNAVCGLCNPGFYEDENKDCQPCGMQGNGAYQLSCLTTPATTVAPPATTVVTTAKQETTSVPPPSQNLAVFFFTVVFLVLGLSLAPILCHSACRRRQFLWTMRKFFRQPNKIYTNKEATPGLPNQSCEDLKPAIPNGFKIEVIPRSPEPMIPPAEVMFPQRPLHIQDPVNTPKVLRNDTVREGWPATVLYTIIRVVPVRRWKEFLRLLCISDGQMERMELDAGPSYLEQQYQMLRLWSQSGSVDVENIYAALRSMDLSGCAQELQDKLEELQWTTETALPDNATA